MIHGASKEQKLSGVQDHKHILNGTPSEALRIAKAGMQGGMTPSSRPWVSISLQDQDLAKFKPVKNWLFDVQRRLTRVLNVSNFYGSTPSFYGELLSFSTANMFVMQDFDTVIRCRPFIIGEYYLRSSATGRINAMMREMLMTALQIRESYGKGENKMDGLPDDVKTALTGNAMTQRFTVINVVAPLEEFSGLEGSDKIQGKHFTYGSVYFPDSGPEDMIYKAEGFRNKPFMAARWQVDGNDTYGGGMAPGILAKGDMNELQARAKDKAKMSKKLVDPALNAPASLKQQGGTIVSGGINYYDAAQGALKMEPVYMVDPRAYQIAREDILDLEQRIKRFFFNDLFLAITQQEGTMTATEVAKRFQEKLEMLGPVVESVTSEFLDPFLDRTLAIMADMHLIPPPPPDLPDHAELQFDYISTLAQAQKIVGTTAIESVVRFVGELAGLKQNLDPFDNLNTDIAVTEYADAMGAPPTLIADPRERDDARQQRAQQQQAMAMASQAKPLAEAGKAASEINLQALQGGPTQ